MRAASHVLALAALAAGAVPAGAQDSTFAQATPTGGVETRVGTRPIRIRVGPSGYVGGGEGGGRETLEQKIARRDRDFRFRSICRGCLPSDAEARVFGSFTFSSTEVVEGRRTAPDWTGAAAGTPPDQGAETR